MRVSPDVLCIFSIRRRKDTSVSSIFLATRLNTVTGQKSAYCSRRSRPQLGSELFERFNTGSTLSNVSSADVNEKWWLCSAVRISRDEQAESNSLALKIDGLGIADTSRYFIFLQFLRIKWNRYNFFEQIEVFDAFNLFRGIGTRGSKNRKGSVNVGFYLNELLNTELVIKKVY